MRRCGASSRKPGSGVTRKSSPPSASSRTSCGSRRSRPVSRSMLKRVEKIERGLLMTDVDEAELRAFDWNCGLAKFVDKWFQVATVRYGVTLEQVVARSWHPRECACASCEDLARRDAPLEALIRASRER